MPPSAPITSSTLRRPDIGGAGHNGSHWVRRLLRRQPARLDRNPIARDARLWEQSLSLANPHQNP